MNFLKLASVSLAMAGLELVPVRAAEPVVMKPEIAGATSDVTLARSAIRVAHAKASLVSEPSAETVRDLSIACRDFKHKCSVHRTYYGKDSWTSIERQAVGLLSDARQVLDEPSIAGAVSEQQMVTAKNTISSYLNAVRNDRQP